MSDQFSEVRIRDVVNIPETLPGDDQIKYIPVEPNPSTTETTRKTVRRRVRAATPESYSPETLQPLEYHIETPQPENYSLEELSHSENPPS